MWVSVHAHTRTHACSATEGCGHRLMQHVCGIRVAPVSRLHKLLVQLYNCTDMSGNDSGTGGAAARQPHCWQGHCAMQIRTATVTPHHPSNERCSKPAPKCAAHWVLHAAPAPSRPAVCAAHALPLGGGLWRQSPPPVSDSAKATEQRLAALCISLEKVSGNAGPAVRTR